MMKPFRELTNPKAQYAASRGRAHWYPYYAGYAPTFVSEMLSGLSLDPDAVVLDPWNGSGTTTTVCSISAVRSTGYDINPSMIVVAKARLLDANTAGSLLPLLSTVLACAKTVDRNLAHEPLTAWFDEGSANRLRAVELAIQHVLADSGTHYTEPAVNVRALSSLAAFYYVLLFRFVRNNLRRVATTNPTWVRAGIDPSSRICVSWREISEGLVADLHRIKLLDGKGEAPHRYAAATLDIADSCELPLGDCTIDAIITSPPYCTRIDYAVSTRAELAVLKVAEDAEFHELRRRMIGTTVSREKQSPALALTPSVGVLLDRIRQHPSKDSSGYYFNNFLDYFTKLGVSFQQMARVLKPGGHVCIVAQDSAYKEIHIDLASIIAEVLAEHNLSLKERHDFPASKSMRQIHSLARNHNVNRLPTESILLFRRQA